MRPDGCRSIIRTPRCRSSSGSGSWPASGSWTSTAGTSVPPPATPAARSASTAAHCPRRRSAALAAHLLGRLTTPSQAAIRAERKIRLQEALNSLDPIDREVLALRHFEELSNAEAAAVLGLDKSAASKRYARALIRLKEILASLPGGLNEV